VLVVDDSQLVRELVSARLVAAGYNVQQAADGSSALRLLDETPDFDVVLTDLRMPTLDGFGLLDAVRRRGLDTEVIVLTGSLAQDPQAAIRAFRLGAKDFLAKQAPHEAVAAVAQAVERRRQAAQLRDMEAALAESERRHRRFVESLHERYIFYRHDRQGHFSYLSPSIERVLGYDPASYHDHYTAMFTDNPLNAEALRRTEGTLSGLPQPAYEIEVRARDGAVHRLEVTESPVFDESGAVIEVEGIARDITESWRAQQALRDSEEKYRSFFEEDLAGNYVATPDGRLLACNSSFAGMFGFSSVEEALAAGLWARYPNAEARQAFLAALRLRKRLKSFAHELRGRDGAVLQVVENTVGHFGPGGELVEIHGYLIDETERKRVEQHLAQSQKIDAVGQLAGGVAHDFNNLLGVITGYCELLHREIGLQHPAQPRLDQIRRAADRAAGLTRQLLAFSRKQVLQPRLLDLNAVVADVEQMLRRLIGEHIQLVTAFAADLAAVMADPGQVEQAIVNLAVNARDAMPRGGRLMIETANTEIDEEYALGHAGAQPGRYVCLTVSDTGHGMDEATLSRVFEPFFTTKERGKGTGLGLSTVYGIVKQSGGYVAAESEPGKGAQFSVYLPAANQPAEPVSPAATKSLPRGGHETVLVLEDEDMLRGIVREMLESAGYRVLDYGSAGEAMHLFERRGEAIHLLLTDVVMPRMSGREIAERLRQLQPNLRVLYMSGYSPQMVDAHGVLEPGTDFIAKPFTVEAILRHVREALDRPGSPAR
jgi:PAS domain S-box-containing protein